MKVKSLTLYVTLCIVAFFSGIYAGVKYENKPQKQEVIAKDEKEETLQAENEIVLVEEPSEEVKVKESFILYATDNGINLYKLNQNGATELIREYETDTESLPSADYQDLCRGISVQSEQEALRLIEDFIS